ncbi:5'-deoxynucleotidase [Clostridia bacterium]|nr:5'-deoxynucleotidase [Clostridia bacterium]
MRSVMPESLAEHAMITALLAQALAVIRRDVFGKPANPDRAASAALLHDASEIITGDMPTPVKYRNAALRDAYKVVERESLGRLVSFLPESMRGSYADLMAGDDVAELVHAADKLAAHIKCVEELTAGNREFKLAERQTLEKLKSMKLPEVDYFIEHFLPSFGLTLDEQEG